MREKQDECSSTKLSEPRLADLHELLSNMSKPKPSNPATQELRLSSQKPSLIGERTSIEPHRQKEELKRYDWSETEEKVR